MRKREKGREDQDLTQGGQGSRRPGTQRWRCRGERGTEGRQRAAVRPQSRGPGGELSVTYVLIIALRAALRSRSANLSTR